jgi:guanosine-3',5'-bis(diphosphate) 3'-pyrophosphohydrolase
MMSRFEMLDMAIKVAVGAHAGQVGKNGEPYILHPLRVMMKQPTTELKTVAVLHDVVEDTKISLNDLNEMGFPPNILRALALLTHDADVPYDIYIENLTKDPLAHSVKFADLQDNLDISRLPEITEEDLARCAKYTRALAYLYAHYVVVT